MRNLLRLAFAVFTWLLAIVTLACAAAFFGNLYLPRTIDAPALVKLGDPLSVNLALLMLFGLQHAGVGRPAFRLWMRRWIPGYALRGVCVIVSCSAAMLWMLLWQPMGGIVWDLQDTAAVITTGLYAVGWVIVIGTALASGHLELLGVRPVLDVVRGIPRSSPALVTHGLHRLVRQPIHLGWLLVLWSAPVMTVTRLLAAAGLSACVVIGVLLEERELVRAIPGYAQYRRKVPMLLPSVTRHLALRGDGASDIESG